MELFRNETSSTSSSALKLMGAHDTWVVTVGGTFDGATVKLQLQDEFGNWIDIPDASSTGAESYSVTLPGGISVRGNVSTTGTQTSIDMGITAVRD